MKGSAFVWWEILAAIFFISVTYIIFTQVNYVYIQPIIKPAILAINSSTANTTAAINTLNIMDMVWSVWPILLIGGLLLYGIVAAQRRDPLEYSY